MALNKIFLDVVTVVNRSLRKFSILQSLNENIILMLMFSGSMTFFSIRGFIYQKFTIHRTAREAEGYFFSFSTPLPYLDNSRMITGRELTSAICQQPDSNQELLVSDCKLLTTLVIDTMIACPILYHIPLNSIN